MPALELIDKVNGCEKAAKDFCYREVLNLMERFGERSSRDYQVETNYGLSCRENHSFF